MPKIIQQNQCCGFKSVTLSTSPKKLSVLKTVLKSFLGFPSKLAVHFKILLKVENLSFENECDFGNRKSHLDASLVKKMRDQAGWYKEEIQICPKPHNPEITIINTLACFHPASFQCIYFNTNGICHMCSLEIHFWSPVNIPIIPILWGSEKLSNRQTVTLQGGF